MPFIAIIIGAILVMAAFNETHGDLAHALEQDIPGYFKWGIAIAVILGLGFIPALRTPSRALLVLVAIVVVLTNYKNIISGFTSFAGADTTQGVGNIDPTTAYVQSGGQSGVPTQAQIAGESGGSNGGGGGSGNPVAAVNPLNPASYLQSFG